MLLASRCMHGWRHSTPGTVTVLDQHLRELVFLTLVFIGSAPHGGCIIKIIEPTAERNQGYSATGYSTLYHFWDLWVLRST